MKKRFYTKLIAPTIALMSFVSNSIYVAAKPELPKFTTQMLDKDHMIVDGLNNESCYTLHEFANKLGWKDPIAELKKIQNSFSDPKKKQFMDFKISCRVDNVPIRESAPTLSVYLGLADGFGDETNALGVFNDEYLVHVCLTPEEFIDLEPMLTYGVQDLYDLSQSTQNDNKTKKVKQFINRVTQLKRLTKCKTALKILVPLSVPLSLVAYIALYCN